MNLSLPSIRRPLLREFLIFLAFLGLTAILTWPWILQLRDAVADKGDPYAISYFLWWDYHQTLHDPLRLFQATILYPHHDTLAFGEFDYGVSLVFFPLFALGFRPLTVYSVAAFLSFPFTGYGTFRLARTLSGSNGVAWVAGVILAFLPFRFHHLAHLHLIFAGWIPLLFEALVLFARTRSWTRAGWLGFAFLMNALTCTTWLILTILPLSISAGLLLSRNNAWRDRKFWLRGAAMLGAALLLLLPFLLPLRRVAAVHGFVRTPDEVRQYSARFINWLAAEPRNKVWGGLRVADARTEMVLFPGLMAPLLALAAFFFARREPRDRIEETQFGRINIILLLLDLMAVISGIIVVMPLAFGAIRLRLFEHVIFSASGPTRALYWLVIALFVRSLIRYPYWLRKYLGGDKNLSESLNSQRRSELFGHALVWIAIGFAGSFGLRFFFHRFLYEHIYIFRGMRVASRWAMICYVGLALLAGLGANRLADLPRRRWSRWGQPATYALIMTMILFELNAAPLKMLRGEADPDALTLALKGKTMSGGILELPIGEYTDHLYMLRAADHRHPLVNGRYSFVPPLQQEIERLIATPPISDQLLDILEAIPVSYVTVHNAFLSAYDRSAIESFMNRGLAMGRLRFINSYQTNDLYAVVRTEPAAKSEANTPASVQTAGSRLPGETVDVAPRQPANPIDDPEFFTRMQYLDFLGREPESGGLAYWMTKILACGSEPVCIDRERGAISAAFFDTKEFQDTGFFIYRVYKATLGCPPDYKEFMEDRAKLALGPELDSSRRSFVEEWIKRREFNQLYPAHLQADQFVDALIKKIASTSGVALENQRRQLIDQLNAGGSRANVVSTLAEDQAFSKAEHNRALVLMQYFAYFKRSPNPEDYAFWVDALDKGAEDAHVEMVRTFVNSNEYRARFAERKANENSKR
jgi:hypothetical protein